MPGLHGASPFERGDVRWLRPWCALLLLGCGPAAARPDPPSPAAERATPPEPVRLGAWARLRANVPFDPASGRGRLEGVDEEGTAYYVSGDYRVSVDAEGRARIAATGPTHAVRCGEGWLFLVSGVELRYGVSFVAPELELVHEQRVDSLQGDGARATFVSEQRGYVVDCASGAPRVEALPFPVVLEAAAGGPWLAVRTPSGLALRHGSDPWTWVLGEDRPVAAPDGVRLRGETWRAPTWSAEGVAFAPSGPPDFPAFAPDRRPPARVHRDADIVERLLLAEGAWSSELMPLDGAPGSFLGGGRQGWFLRRAPTFEARELEMPGRCELLHLERRAAGFVCEGVYFEVDPQAAVLRRIGPLPEGTLRYVSQGFAYVSAERGQFIQPAEGCDDAALCRVALATGLGTTVSETHVRLRDVHGPWALVLGDDWHLVGPSGSRRLTEALEPRFALDGSAWSLAPDASRLIEHTLTRELAVELPEGADAARAIDRQTFIALVGEDLRLSVDRGRTWTPLPRDPRGRGEADHLDSYAPTCPLPCPIAGYEVRAGRPRVAGTVHRVNPRSSRFRGSNPPERRAQAQCAVDAAEEPPLRFTTDQRYAVWRHGGRSVRARLPRDLERCEPVVLEARHAVLRCQGAEGPQLVRASVRGPARTLAAVFGEADARALLRPDGAGTATFITQALSPTFGRVQWDAAGRVQAAQSPPERVVWEPAWVDGPAFVVRGQSGAMMVDLAGRGLAWVEEPARVRPCTEPAPDAALVTAYRAYTLSRPEAPVARLRLGPAEATTGPLPARVPRCFDAVIGMESAIREGALWIRGTDGRRWRCVP